MTTTDLIDNIVFSDEATFCLNGRVNRHNCRYWSTQNPHWIIDSHSQRPQINMWAGISGRHITGPFFIDGNLTGQRYLQLFQEQVILTCTGIFPDENNLNTPNNLWYPQEGPPPHYEINVRRYLDVIFPNRSIAEEML